MKLYETIMKFLRSIYEVLYETCMKLLRNLYDTIMNRNNEANKKQDLR